MDQRGVVEPLARWIGWSPTARLVSHLLRELVDHHAGRAMWTALRSTRRHGAPGWPPWRHVPDYYAKTDGYTTARDLVGVAGWAVAHLAEVHQSDAPLSQFLADKLVCGAIDGMSMPTAPTALTVLTARRPITCATRAARVALLDQLVRVAGRRPTCRRHAMHAAWTRDTAILDWVWGDGTDAAVLARVLEYASDPLVLRWLVKCGIARVPRRLTRAGTGMNQLFGEWPMRWALEQGDVAFVREFLVETRCLGRQIAWVFDYALERMPLAPSTLPILQLIVDRFRMRHLRLRGRARAIAALERFPHSHAARWVVERFVPDRQPDRPPEPDWLLWPLWPQPLWPRPLWWG